MTKTSLAVAIEALSWMAYAGIGERTALFKAAKQINVKGSDELRQAHRVVMETTRFRNRIEQMVSGVIDSDKLQRMPHGITSFLRVLSYLKLAGASQSDLARNVEWARQILGWKQLHPYEKSMATILSVSRDIGAGELSEVQHVSLDTCHPSWFVERLMQVFGRAFALQVLRRNLTLLPSYVRLNPLRVWNKTRQDEIAHSLRGSEVQQIHGILRLNLGRPLVRSDLWVGGEIVIQDLASITVSLVASPRPGCTVLDICAAPGNKTTHLAALMRNLGRICSVDISAKRLLHWKTEMKRTGCSIAEAIHADATRIPLKEKGDVVVVDPPCSNSGVFARNPSIKWRTTPARVRDLASWQFAILQAASTHVESGGVLVYCTCSILPEENENVLEVFLRRNPNFRVTPQTPFIGLPGLRGFDQCQRFYSHLHDCNGYFIAKLLRSD